MAQIKLRIFELGQSPREEEFAGGEITIGRTPENDIALPSDSNISRAHALIELREDENGDEEFWLVDLRSSNGTFLNNERVSPEKPLKSGDLLNIGGASVIEFRIVEEEPEEVEEESGEANAETVAKPKGRSASMLVVSALAGGLAIASLGGAGLYYYYPNNSCPAEVTFLSPGTGDTISESTEIQVKVVNKKCIKSVTYELNGEPLETVTDAPYTTTLEPKPELSDGGTYNLVAIVADKKGNKITGDSVALDFNVPKPPITTDTPNVPIGTNPPIGTKTPPISTSRTPTPIPTGTPNLIDIQNMSQNLVKQFSGVSYTFSDKQFFIDVQKRTAEYQSEGFFARAQQYNDVVKDKFVGEKGLDPPIGYILAMSRSKYDTKPNGVEEGLWKMSADLATPIGYPEICGGGTLSEPTQACAARVAAEYTKRLLIDRFNGSFIYAVACFGMTMDEAGAFQVSIANKDQSDFAKLLTNPRQREQVVRFFAAGIVANNPQKFGLKRERPILDLYAPMLIK